MSAGEVVWRARKAVTARLERHGIGLARGSVPDQHARGLSWRAADRTGRVAALLPDPWFDHAPYRAAAERVLSGRFDVFALRGTELGFPPAWNRDPKTGIETALVFGKTLNYRDSALVGDIKYLWEPNRHYELVTLAQAFHLTREVRYADACRTLLDSWMAQCPYPLGQGWSSSLENGIRLTNWAVAWHLLDGGACSLFDGADGAAFRGRWMASIYCHCHFIAGHFSRHSSANNHLLGECMGLFIGAVTWPCWPESKGWQHDAWRQFMQQALCQTGADGVNREQAIWYHHEVADMMLLCGLFARANGVDFGDGYWARLFAMLDFIVAVMDEGGNVPMIGDADDAVMVRFSQEHGFHAYRSLLATGAVLSGRVDFKRHARQFDHKSRWLLGAAGASAYSALGVSGDADAEGENDLNPAPRRSFPGGGYYLLGDAFDTAQEVRIIADAGPLGYLSIAAHGHADALSLTLSAAGRPLLIDPGTYAYHTEARWRRYFRGTAAHNTVRVDGCDQSVQGGSFLWLQQARAQCERWDFSPERDCFIGMHDGYRRLKDPVIHRRKITFEKTVRSLIVEDYLECRGEHDIEWHWHIAPECTVTTEDNHALVVCGGVSMTIALPQAPGTVRLAYGQDAPPLGWISRRFDEKEPAPTLVRREHICGSVVRITVFRLTLPSPD